MNKQVYEFITTQTGEKIVERKKCPVCGQEFAITDRDLGFYSKISPVFNGTKYEIPAPTLGNKEDSHEEMRGNYIKGLQV